MAKRKAMKEDRAKSNQQHELPAAGETISGYFRKVFADNPQLLEGRSNDAILERWRHDHPGQEISKQVKQGLQNVKSILRSRGRKGAKRKQAQAQAATAVAAPAPVKPPPHKLEALEVAIDDCLMLARNLDPEKLADAIQMLRRARNAVVWMIGQ
jgi:hypothetical protein